jgi:ankyrin repeat protein
MYSTPLHLACIRGYIECARMLISAGGNIDAIDSDGNTPCHFASQNGHENLLKLLLHKDPDLGVENNIGMSAPEMATEPEIIHIFYLHLNQHKLLASSDDYCRFYLEHAE